MKKILTISTLAILLLFSSVSSCFAYSVNNTYFELFNACLEYLEENNIEYYDYYVLSANSYTGYHFWFTTDENATFYKGKIGDRTDVDFYCGNYYMIFYFNAEDKEVSPYSVQGATLNDAVNATRFDPVYSSKAIPNGDGSVFFQATPLTWVEITQGAILEKTPAMGAKVVAQMKTILLCGVGCLALLIALPLLARVLRRFLAR